MLPLLWRKFPRKLISHCNSMNSNMLLTRTTLISCAVTAIIWKATSNPGMCRAVWPRSQQRQLERLLKKRIGTRRDFTLGCKLASVQLDLAEYDTARQTIDALSERWPQREEPWLLQLRMAAILHNGTAIQDILHKIKEQNVYLTSKGQEIVNFWYGKEDSK